jgi:hypothetical protein
MRQVSAVQHKRAQSKSKSKSLWKVPPIDPISIAIAISMSKARRSEAKPRSELRKRGAAVERADAGG